MEPNKQKLKRKVVDSQDEPQTSNQLTLIEQKLGLTFISINFNILNSIKEYELFDVKSMLKEAGNFNQKNLTCCYGIIYSKPKLISGNLGMAYITFELMDLETLSYLTPVLVQTSEKYSREYNLDKLKLPQVLDIILVKDPTFLTGVDTQSRNSILMDLKGKKNENKILNLGTHEKFSLCTYQKCPIIIDSVKYKLCSEHQSLRFSLYKGQRMEVASSVNGFKLFTLRHSSIKGVKECTQFDKSKGPESYFLDSEETVTIYPTTSENRMSKKEYDDYMNKMSVLREHLSKSSNYGGQVLKEAMDMSAKKNKIAINKKQADDFEEGKKTNQPLSLEACTMLAKKALSFKKESSGIDLNKNTCSGVFEKFRVSQLINSKIKIKEILNKIEDPTNKLMTNSSKVLSHSKDDKELELIIKD